ncbi:MAG: DUF3987 domain-containing protein [Mediterranea sp.]|jgi:hypothetical protein|nr:DUF3987 domain-containing protein [Mediterranea sp.]
MKNLELIHVSVFQGVRDRRPVRRSLLEALAECLRPTQKVADDVAHIRRYHAEGRRADVDTIKRRLPAFTPSGVFEGGHSRSDMVEHSGIVCLDYDHVGTGDDRLRLLNLAAADSHTVSVIESPSDGLKVFAHVEGATAARHAEAVAIAAAHYDPLLGLEHDGACKDPCRLCFFTHSPSGYIAAIYTSFELGEEEEPLAEVPRQPDGTPPPRPATARAGKSHSDYLQSLIFRYPLLHGQRHANVFRIACAAARGGIDREETCGAIREALQGTDFPDSELQQTVSDGYKGNHEERRRTNEGKMKIAKSQKIAESRYDPPRVDEESEEAYWAGEEFRKNTPLIPDSVYENLPILLEESMLDDCTPRERDVALLSQLTCLSAVLPATYGNHRRKPCAPHVFCFVSAPAGSGKGVARTGRLLVEAVDARRMMASKIEEERYARELDEWKALHARAGKKGKGDERTPIPPEPKRPPFKTLFLSTTTSNTRMQIQMRDNGDDGSLMCDTEAQTLSSANGLDCGKFDDLLRKAFEHEPIDSSYKANGMEPIRIRDPRLALLLTGTPAQFSPILSSSENGLVSRVLYYTYRETPRWIDVGDDDYSLDDQFAPLAERVLALHDFCLAHPVRFRFSYGQLARLNATFARKLGEVTLEQNDDLQAVVKRYALILTRLCMVFARLRQAESGSQAETIGCTDEDFQRAMDIVMCCYEHGRLLLSSMSGGEVRPLRDPNMIKDFFSDLPDEFTTKQAEELGTAYGFYKGKVPRLIKSATGQIIRRLSHGVYQKTN